MNAAQQKTYDSLQGSQLAEVDRLIRDGYEVYSENASDRTVTMKQGFSYKKVDQQGRSWSI